MKGKRKYIPLQRHEVTFTQYSRYSVKTSENRLIKLSCWQFQV